MAKIKVIRGGCGITYKDAHEVTRHALKTTESGPFECDDAQADRLVRLGVAAYVAAPEKAATQKAPDAPAQEPETAEEPKTVTGHLDAAELETWEYNALKKLAADMHAEPKGKKKADLIAAIVAVEVEADADDPDEPPELGAVDPE
ncbi:hypothetical protein [Eisenbergiella sp.]